MRGSLFAIVLSIATPTMALDSDIDVRNIATKLIHEPNSSGNVLFAIKCDVRNRGAHKKETYVILQGVDSDGFELKSVVVTAKLKPGESKTVSNQNYMQEKDFKRARWQVKD